MTSAGSLNTAALGDWLKAARLEIELPLKAERFAGGQSNPTYMVSDAAGRRYVLRKKPDGPLLPSAHAVDREYRVMKALENTGVPVPAMVCLCDSDAVIGTPFFVMEYVQGRIFWDPALPELTPTQRRAVYQDMNRVVAALHSVDPALVGLSDYGRSGEFFARQISRWTRQYRESETEHSPAMERLIDWLPGHIPPPRESRVFHGDLRIDNMIFHPSEPRIIALLDWELSTLGDPLADFAYHALPWRLTSWQFRGMADKDPFSLGIPSEREYLQTYCEATRCHVDQADYEFCIAYSLFRLSAILQGIMKRAMNGTAASAQALETGSKARTIAELAWRQVGAYFG